jgi:hypothetical protein
MAAAKPQKTASKTKGKPTRAVKPPEATPEPAEAPEADPALEGIEFAEEGGGEVLGEVQGPPEMDSLAQAEANSAKAMEAIDKMRSGEAAPPPVAAIPGMPVGFAWGQKPPPATREEEAALLAKKKFYRVEHEQKIRRGASAYLLIAGKIIDNNQYDIESLRRQGVQLTEVNPKEINVRPTF